jgi:hypothetical protein
LAINGGKLEFPSQLNAVFAARVRALRAVDTFRKVQPSLEGLVRNLDDNDGARRAITFAEFATRAILTRK